MLMHWWLWNILFYNDTLFSINFMKTYKTTVKLFHEFMKFKNDLLQHITTEIFYNYHKDIDNGDLIFNGSIVHDRLGIIKKQYYGDIDISINVNSNGDEIVKTFLQFLSEIDLTYYRNKFNDYYSNKIIVNNNEIIDDDNIIDIDDDNKLSFGKIIVLDIFRNEHPENSNEYENIELYPNVYTKYFGYEWNLSKYYFTYQDIIKLTDEEKRNKQFLKFVNIFETHLNLMDKNDFQDKILLKNIEKVINLTKYPTFL